MTFKWARRLTLVDMTTETRYRIAEVAARSGYTPATLRYYEDIGLLPPVERAGNGYRLYDTSTLDRLAFVTRAKQLGCSLEEIAELSGAWESGHCASVQQRLQDAVAAKLSDTHARIAELTTLAADLQRAAATLGSHTPDGPCDDRCGCTSSPASGPAPVALTAGASPVGDGDPIACSLDGERMAGRLDDWNELLADVVVGRSAIDGGVRLALRPGADVTEVARLAAAEQDCCRFFAFALVIDGRGPALEVRAPADAQDVLTALLGAPA